ncbi:MAG TPA: nucleotide disphospho-sugar-binding domain-containing protein [Gemmatimonadales bacterium]|nr:nucleotide disphospho-sugar-binding domain-containing protein [Gemmatimonadales bacterium]
MAKILVYTSTGHGHFSPPMATALALRARGHEVCFRTSREGVDAIGRLGLSAEPVDPQIESVPLEDWKARTPLGALSSALETMHRRGRYEVPDMRAAIEAERPDLIWVDTHAPGAAMAAEASGRPWAHYMPYPHPRPARGVPVFGPGFAPSSSPPARLRDSGLRALGRAAFRPTLRRHNARRVTLGLAPVDSSDDLFLVAPLLIHFTAEPFEYAREWPENVRHVGPALWEPPAPDPDWLAAEDRPIILVTASTEFQDDAKLIRCALEAFADRPYALVATTSAHDPADFRAPANARVERYLPHGPIIRRAAAVISHGGMGTTQKALAAGVPVCVVPFIRDQSEVARRAEHCGGGTMLRPHRLRPDRLRAAVEEAIACRPGAEKVRDAFHKAGGAEAAASTLEGLI